MINDLGTEATTVHTRFPYALTIFFVVLPSTALMLKQENDITRTLERMGTRKNVIDAPHLAESISLIVWDPETGSIDSERPMKTSNLRLEKAHQRIEEIYLERYKGLPPHD